MRSLALRLYNSASDGEVEVPRRKTVCAFAVFVSVLALLRQSLLPVGLCVSVASFDVVSVQKR